MYRYFMLFGLIFNCQAQEVTHPSNPNYYPYVPDQNASYRLMGRSDQKIEIKIREKLRPWFQRGYEGQLNIEVDNGNVNLYGTVENQNDKDNIEHTVRKVDGVRSINNQLSVRSYNRRSAAW